MPIRAIDRTRYPKDWREISDRIRFGRAGGRCEQIHELLVWQGGEWVAVYQRCEALHGARHPLTGALVILTVGHLDHTPEHNGESNLRAMCQRCHNRHDRLHRNKTRRAWFIRPLELFPVSLFMDAPIELRLKVRRYDDGAGQQSSGRLLDSGANAPTG